MHLQIHENIHSQYSLTSFGPSWKAVMETDLFENSGANEEQYEEELTAAEVLQKLEDAWLNEKHAPELLESKMEIVS